MNQIIYEVLWWNWSYLVLLLLPILVLIYLVIPSFRKTNTHVAAKFKYLNLMVFLAVSTPLFISIYYDSMLFTQKQSSNYQTLNAQLLSKQRYYIS
ncbi:hypothetical protein [Aliikangiella sp. IMCC44632]